MAGSSNLPEGLGLKEKYEWLITSLKALMDGESDALANMANFVALIHHTFGFHWTGFYLNRANELVLGPFQGPVACTRILEGKGVCGTSMRLKKTMVIENVHEFPGHIACSALSNSELVIPLFDKRNAVIAVLDIDSTEIGFFSAEHVKGMESCVQLMQIFLFNTPDEELQRLIK